MDETNRKRSLERWALQSAARDLVGTERVAWCFRRIGFDWLTMRRFRDVRLMFSPSVHRAHYKNLMVCGSVWMCPICAAKISERRRSDLSSAIARTELNPVLVTFTLSHNRDDKLKNVVRDLTKSYANVREGKAWETFKRRENIVGSVRALEVTHGANGWHPHLHILYFVRGEVGEERIKKFFWDRWHRSLLRNKRTATSAHGIDVRVARDDVGDYVTKFGHEPIKTRWGVEHELTKSPAKIARAGGRSPLQLLADYAAGDKQAGALWKEYALTFKGQRQLVWSKGLRSLLGLGTEKSDAEIAKETREDAVLLAALGLDVWRVVLGNDARGELLEVAHSGNADAVWQFLATLGVRDARRDAGRELVKAFA